MQGIAVVVYRRDTVDPDPPQLSPVIGVVIDQQAHLWVSFDIGQPSQPLGGLGLGVYSGVDDLVAKRKHHRHQVRRAVRGDGAQPGYRRMREAGLGVEVDHNAEPRGPKRIR